MVKVDGSAGKGRSYDRCIPSASDGYNRGPGRVCSAWDGGGWAAAPINGTGTARAAALAWFGKKGDDKEPKPGEGAGGSGEGAEGEGKSGEKAGFTPDPDKA